MSNFIIAAEWRINNLYCYVKKLSFTIPLDQLRTITNASGTTIKDWWYNGYVLAPYSLYEYPSNNMDEIIDSIPVHGGITYNEEENGKTKLGFDTQHLNDVDPNSLTWDLEWVKHETNKLAIAVDLLIKYRDIIPSYTHTSVNLFINNIDRCIQSGLPELNEQFNRLRPVQKRSRIQIIKQYLEKKWEI